VFIEKLMFYLNTKQFVESDFWTAGGDRRTAEQIKIDHQGKVVGWILQGRNATRADLQAGRERKNLIYIQMSPAEEDVVDRVATLTVTAHLPRRVRRLWSILSLLAVSRVEFETRVGTDRGIDRLGGFRVEIASQHNGTVLVDVSSQKLENIFALLVAQRRQEGALARLEMSRSYTNLFSTGFVSKDCQDDHLEIKNRRHLKMYPHRSTKKRGKGSNNNNAISKDKGVVKVPPTWLL